MRRPVMTELIFGYLRLLEKNIEQGLALAFVHVLDRDRELWIDEQDLAAGHRVHAYDRMNRGRVQLLPTHHVLSILFGIVEQFTERLEVVNRFEALAGGTVDIVARQIGQQLSALLGQPVVIDNRPGGGTTIALKAIAISEPDGYTLLLGSTGSLTI